MPPKRSTSAKKAKESQNDSAAVVVGGEPSSVTRRLGGSSSTSTAVPPTTSSASATVIPSLPLPKAEQRRKNRADEQRHVDANAADGTTRAVASRGNSRTNSRSNSKVTSRHQTPRTLDAHKALRMAELDPKNKEYAAAAASYTLPPADLYEEEGGRSGRNAAQDDTHAYVPPTAASVNATAASRGAASSSVVSSARHSELGGEGNATHHHHHGHKKRRRQHRLYTFDELPVHLRDNPFILTHYRAYLSSAECVKSVFEIHNETGNIWTHLLGFLFFLAVGIWTMVDVIPEGAGFGHYAIFAILTLGSMGCMACSTTFHTMAAHDDLNKFKKFHALDYLGITLLIIASFIPCCYYVFVCQPWLQWGYMAMICCIGSAGIITPLMPCFEEEYFFWPRLGIYVSIVCSAVVPLIHTCVSTPLNMTTGPIYVGVILMLLLYGTGVIVYATNFPERWAPGRFDLILMSHQIWHWFVLAAAIVHYFTSIALYQNWLVMRGHC